MERPIHSPINTSTQDLDTPALVVDKDNITANQELFSQAMMKMGKELIPDVSVHGSVGLASIQTGGARDNQIYCSTLQTAEIFREHQFSNLAITLPAPNKESLTRVINLAAISSLSIGISNSTSLDRMIVTAEEFHSEINVNLILSNSHEHRGFVLDDKLKTAIQAIGSSNKLKFDGFTIEAKGLDSGMTAKLLNSLNSFMESQKAILPSAYCIYLHGDPLEVEAYSGTTPIKIVNGDYLFSGFYRKKSEVNSCWILSTVMSYPEPGRWYLDCGQKGISIDRGLPSIIDDSPIEIERMSAEHGYVISNGREAALKLGDRIKLTPANYGDAFNLYDFISLSSKGKLVETLKIEARGAFN